RFRVETKIELALLPPASPSGFGALGHMSWRLQGSSTPWNPAPDAVVRFNATPITCDRDCWSGSRSTNFPGAGLVWDTSGAPISPLLSPGACTPVTVQLSNLKSATPFGFHPGSLTGEFGS